MIEMCNNEEILCRVVSNGGVLWDGTGHEGQLLSVLDTMLRVLYGIQSVNHLHVPSKILKFLSGDFPSTPCS